MVGSENAILGTKLLQPEHYINVEKVVLSCLYLWVFPDVHRNPLSKNNTTFLQSCSEGRGYSTLIVQDKDTS